MRGFGHFRIHEFWTPLPLPPPSFLQILANIGLTKNFINFMKILSDKGFRRYGRLKFLDKYLSENLVSPAASPKGKKSS